MSSEIPASSEADGGFYDPELPFLHILERDVRRHARHVERARRLQRAHSGRAHASTSAPVVFHSGGGSRAGEGPRVPLSARVARRSLTLLALLSLIGATAFGAGHILSAGAPNPEAVRQSAFVAVASGTDGSEHWSLRAYTRGEELCSVLDVGDAEASRCSDPPGAGSLGATSVLSQTRRYLFGVSGRTVAAVTARAAGSRTISARTLRLPPLGARIPAGERWYVIVLARPVGEPDPPLRVQGLDRGGQPIGAVVEDCAETAEPRGCAR